eukprot:scaffold75326_cov23-Tisochrysis_lutea.AAC.1
MVHRDARYRPVQTFILQRAQSWLMQTFTGYIPQRQDLTLGPAPPPLGHYHVQTLRCHIPPRQHIPQSPASSCSGPHQAGQARGGHGRLPVSK